MQTSGNTILITGGGTGIGEALAHRLHDRGNTVIVAGRRTDALDRTAAGRERIHVLPLDIDDPAQISTFAARLLREFPETNVLVNNAWIMRFEPGLAHDRDLSDAEAMIATNLLGPIRLTNALVEHLAGRPGAAIVNVSSGLAFVPLVAAPTYSATKAALHSYTVSLRAALRGRIEVIEIAPPGVRTELTPGQDQVEQFLPLADFADEVMALLDRTPTPPEILVDAVQFLRNAEAEGRFETALSTINPPPH